MRRLAKSYKLALDALVRKKKLGFVEATQKIAKYKKQAEVENFRKSLASGTPKMRLIAHRKMLRQLVGELHALHAKSVMGAETIVKIGAIEQKINDLQKKMMEDAAGSK